MKIVFVLLGLVDIAAAALVFFPFSEAVMLYVMVYMLAKGGFFLTTGIASRSMGLWCITMCGSDVLVGIALGAISLGYAMPGNVGIIPLLLKAIGIIGLVKGLYTTVTPAVS